jgi:SAM-dependent methyltransferase
MLRSLMRRVAQQPSSGEQGVGFYDRRYREKASKRLPYHLQPYYGLWTVIADRVRHRAVLEVGCGPGHLAALLADQGVRPYVGFDFSPAAIDLAKTQRPDLDFRVADAFTTDLFRTAQYDTIICTEVLEHIERDRELIARWPSGIRCLCSVPDFPGKAHVRHFDTPDTSDPPVATSESVSARVPVDIRSVSLFVIAIVSCVYMMKQMHEVIVHSTRIILFLPAARSCPTRAMARPTCQETANNQAVRRQRINA